ncbi:MAG: mechanosensitive ion channel family protein [Planctomycetes bacterium]|nr:mechanosensitive ion channel family protein [Planctomycetota bacterium]
MPTPLLPILAQQAPPAPQPVPPGGPPVPPVVRETTILEPPTKIFGRDYDQPPVIAIPVLLACLALVSIIVERVASWLVKKLTSRTKTTVDDAFVKGLPKLVRTVLVFVALTVVVQALAHDPARLETWTRVVRAVGIIAVGLVVTRVGLSMVDAWVRDRPQMSPVGPGIKLALKIAVIPVLLVTVLQVFGVEIAAFLTVLGVGSLAVALALQDILKNIFSGIQLVLDQPIRPGDFISIDDGKVRGTVLEIGLRSTKLRTTENNVAILPNANLANALIVNMDSVDPTFVHTVAIGVAYASDSRRVHQMLTTEAQRAVDEIPELVKQAPIVAFAGFGDSALNFTVAVRVARFSQRADTSTELHHRLLARLNAEGIEIPFPTRTVLVRPDGARPPI